mmetsp:Transcript_22918/g.23146  ORF Transcript_22918/g.23146 Transcript_22918/m.23146 type:complete len:346 (+) Transcript_22918:318-1355(+)
MKYQTIVNDDSEDQVADKTSSDVSSKYRSSVLAGAVLLILASVTVIFQTGYFSGSSSVEVISFAAFARRDPGEPMLNTDELWPCKADPQIPRSTCDQGKVLDGTHTYSNVYVDTGYPTTNLPPYKMVYYKNNVWLYARQYATSDCAWSKIFTQVVGGGIFCDGEEITADDWGTPYWKMSDHVPELKPKKLNKKKVTRFEFDANKNDNRYSIKFQKVRLTNKGVKFNTKFRLDLIRPVWNCDKVQFILNTDGNLCLATYQSPEARAVTKMQCNVLFQSNNFMYNGGATLIPTAEPTAEPDTVSGSTTSEPTSEPTAASGGINDSLEEESSLGDSAGIFQLVEVDEE